MRSGRKADVASTRLSSSEATVIYNEVAPTALLKSEMRPTQSSSALRYSFAHGETVVSAKTKALV
jgi:hypothetical protein